MYTQLGSCTHSTNFRAGPAESGELDRLSHTWWNSTTSPGGVPPLRRTYSCRYVPLSTRSTAYELNLVPGSTVYCMYRPVLRRLPLVLKLVCTFKRYMYCYSCVCTQIDEFRSMSSDRDAAVRARVPRCVHVPVGGSLPTAVLPKCTQPYRYS